MANEVLALGYPAWGDALLGFPFPWRSCHDPYNYDAMNLDRCWPLLLIADLVFWIVVVYIIFRPLRNRQQDI